MFSFDLETNEESKVDGYYHDENTNDMGSVDDDEEDEGLDDCKTIEEITLLLNNLGVVKSALQYNITFSKPFGPICD